jgi:hypothetical protein
MENCRVCYLEQPEYRRPTRSPANVSRRQGILCAMGLVKADRLEDHLCRAKRIARMKRKRNQRKTDANLTSRGGGYFPAASL